MKKLIALITAVLTILCLPLSTSAKKDFDSVTLPSEEKELFQDTQKDTVVKIYNGAFMHGFSDKKDIETLISYPIVIEEMYMVKTREKIVFRHLYADKVENIMFTRSESWYEFSKFALHPGKVFGPSVSVYNVYCLNGEPSYDGVYIYYSTSKGDFVLFKEYLDAEKEYLFPVSDFYGFAEIIFKERYENRDLDGGIPPIEELFDLKPYEFHSRQIIIIATVSVSAIVIVCAVLLAVNLRKKRKA